MAEFEWRADDGAEVTLSRAQVVAIAEHASREDAGAIRIRAPKDAGGQASDELEFATWDPLYKWFGPYRVRKQSGHILPPYRES